MAWRSGPGHDDPEVGLVPGHGEALDLLGSARRLRAQDAAEVLDARAVDPRPVSRASRAAIDPVEQVEKVPALLGYQRRGNLSDAAGRCPCCIGCVCRRVVAARTASAAGGEDSGPAGSCGMGGSPALSDRSERTGDRSSIQSIVRLRDGRQQATVRPARVHAGDCGQPVVARPRMPSPAGLYVGSGQDGILGGGGDIMNARHRVRTLAILGLRACSWGGLASPWCAAGAVRPRRANRRGGRARPTRAARPGSVNTDPRMEKGKGWGWIWGKDDEVGSLNAHDGPRRGRRRMALATRGEVFDLGLTYSRRSYKWPGHSPGEIITFRSPDGVHRMKDPDAPPAAARTPTRSTGIRRRCSSPTTWRRRSTAWPTSRPGWTTTGTTASRRRTGAATGARASATPRRSRRSSPAAC